MQCGALLFTTLPHTSTPLFDILAGLCPFVFLAVVMQGAEVLNKIEQHRVTKDNGVKSTPHFRLSAMEQQPAVETSPAQPSILVQYYTTIRWLIIIDFVAVMFILIATDPKWLPFQVLSAALRYVYRLIEFLVCVILCAPIDVVHNRALLCTTATCQPSMCTTATCQQPVDRCGGKRCVYRFAWRPVVAGALACSSLGVLCDIVACIIQGGHCLIPKVCFYSRIVTTTKSCQCK